VNHLPVAHGNGADGRRHVHLPFVRAPSARLDDGGATAVECALFIGLIAAAIFGAVLALGLSVLGLFTAPITAGF
jgi:Flp pilus assembly pilin Flp